MSPLRHALGQVTHAMTWNNKDNSSFSGGKPKNLSALSPTPPVNRCKKAWRFRKAVICGIPIRLHGVILALLGNS